MSKEGLIIAGAGGHGVSVLDAALSACLFDVLGFLDDWLPDGSMVLGFPVLCRFERVTDFIGEDMRFVVGLGQIKSPGRRVELYERISQSGGKMATILASTAYVSTSASIGLGSVVLHGAVVNARAVVGENCIVNSMALVEHDAIVGAHSHVATGARINGSATVGRESFIGSGAVLIQESFVPDNSVISAGAVILNRYAGEVR